MSVTAKIRNAVRTGYNAIKTAAKDTLKGSKAKTDAILYRGQVKNAVKAGKLANKKTAIEIKSMKVDNFNKLKDYKKFKQKQKTIRTLGRQALAGYASTRPTGLTSVSEQIKSQVSGGSISEGRDNEPNTATETTYGRGNHI